MKIGVAHSMLMAGCYSKNTDSKLSKYGFNDREQVEHEGPERAARDMINLIKQTAVQKKELTKTDLKEIDITVAMVGDSRTGKSEMAEKMEEERLKNRNFGKKSLNEIKAKIQEMGLSLGMTFELDLLKGSSFED